MSALLQTDKRKENEKKKRKTKMNITEMKNNTNIYMHNIVCGMCIIVVN